MRLEDTLQRLAPGLLRFSVGLCADAAQGEEVAQDAMTALVGRWRRHGPPEDPAAFVYAVARRRAARGRWRQRLMRPLDWLSASAPARGDLEAEVGARRELARVFEVLEGLRPRDREVLLTAISALDVASGARALGLSPSAYKMRLHRARGRLREIMEGQDVHILT